MSMRKEADFPCSPCEGKGLICEGRDVLEGEGGNLGGLRFRGGKDGWIGMWLGMY